MKKAKETADCLEFYNSKAIDLYMSPIQTYKISLIFLNVIFPRV